MVGISDSEMIYSVDNYNNMLQNFSRWILDKRFLSSDFQNHWPHPTLFRLHFEAIIYLCVCFHIVAKRLNANFQCLKHIMRIAPVWLCKNASKLRKCWLKIQKKKQSILRFCYHQNTSNFHFGSPYYHKNLIIYLQYRPKYQ